MAAQDDISLVRRLLDEVWNQGRMEVAKDIIHDDYSSHEGITFSSFRGLKVLVADMKFYNEQYPDLKFKIGVSCANDGVVMTSWHATGKIDRGIYKPRR